MSRRLAATRQCAVCAETFRLSHAAQICCGHACAAVRRARMQPLHHNMLAANAAKKSAFEAQLAESLDGLSVIEAYRRGYTRGVRTTHQRLNRQRAA